MWLSYIALAIAPGLAISCYVYWRDRFDREPLRLLVLSFFSGCLSVIPAILFQLIFMKLGIGQRGDTLQTAVNTFLIVALSEEISKFYQLKRYYYNKAFDEPYDGITYSVMVSMGFATLENILYVWRAQDPLATGIVRLFTAVPAHATFAIMMGYFVGLAKFKGNNAITYQVIGVAAAVLFHGAYDFFLLINNRSYMWIGAILSLLAGIFFSFRAIKLHQQRSKGQFNISNEITS